MTVSLHIFLDASDAVIMSWKHAPLQVEYSRGKYHALGSSKISEDGGQVDMLH